MLKAKATYLLCWSAIALLAAGCGGSGGGGGGGGGKAAEINELLGYQAAEGTKSEPLAIGDAATAKIILHEKGTVASGGSAGIGDSADSYYTATVQPGVEYLVTLSALTADADLYVYNDDGTFTTRECANRPAFAGLATETCTFVANRDTIYVAVDGSKTDKGAQFNLSVIVKPVSEGSLNTPATLADPNTAPVTRPASTVGGNEISYYTVNVNAVPTYTSTYNALMTNSPSAAPGPTCPGTHSYYWYWYNYSTYTTDPDTGYPTDIVGTIACYDSNWNYYGTPVAYSVHYTYDTTSAGGCPTGWYYGNCNQQIPRAYLITVTDLTDDVDLYVSDDVNDYFSSGTGRWETITPTGAVVGTACQATAAGAAMELCKFPGIAPADYQFLGYPQTVPLYIAVDRSFASDGAAFTINVVEQPYAEGAPAGDSYTAPDMGISYTLPVTLCTLFQSTDPTAPCFTGYHYRYDPATYMYVNPDLNKSYTVACPGPKNAASITENQPQDNGNDESGWWNRDCLGTVAAGGAPGMPKVLDVGIDSFYRVKVDPNKQYLLKLQKPTDAVDLYVYDKDSTFRTELTECQPPWEEPSLQRCILNPTRDYVYFAVDGYPSTGGATYELIVHEVYKAENNGSGGPKVLVADTATSGDLTGGTHFRVGIKTTGITPVSYQGMVIDGGALGISSAEDSYYKLTGLNPAVQYRVQISGLYEDADLYVYGGDSSFGQDPSLATSGMPCVPKKTGKVTETCLVSPDTNGNIYLAVDGFWSLDGTSFDLTVEEPTSEGCVSWYSYCAGYYGPLSIGYWYPGGYDISYTGFVKGDPSGAINPRSGSPCINADDIFCGGAGHNAVSYYYAQVQPYDAQGNPQSFEVALNADPSATGLRLSVFKYNYDYSNMFNNANIFGTCTPQTISAGKASCTVTPINGDWMILIAVDGYNANSAGFTLTVKPVATATTGEGLASAPVEVGSVTVADGVSSGDIWGSYLGHATRDVSPTLGIGGADTGDSYYVVNVTAGYTYYLGIYNYGTNSGPADLYVYQDAGSASASFAGTAACQPNASLTYNGYMWDAEWYYMTYYPTEYTSGIYPYYDKWCTVTATGNKLYIGVDGSRVNSVTPANTRAQYNIYAYWGWY